jgi:4'-phosphopantetheinyl transferase
LKHPHGGKKPPFALKLNDLHLIGEWSTLMTLSDDIWVSPPADLVLPADAVHIWRGELNQPAGRLDQLASTLSPDEHERAARFHFDHHRRHFIAGRGMLRAILGRYLNVPPSQLEFTYSAKGKPSLATSLPHLQSNLRFNLSHSHELALYALTYGRDLGVDLEHVGRKIEGMQIADRFFSPREVRVLRSLPDHLQREAFFTCWTRKEAFIKARGDGLSLPLDQFDVTLRPGEPAVLLRTDFDPPEVGKWSLQALSPGPGYVGAVAVAGHGLQLGCWQWSV